MVNMSQKTTDQKRHRRTRLKRAMEPLLKRFGCTQMQVAGCVDGMLKDNERMKAKIELLEKEIEQLKETIKVAEVEITTQKTRIKILEVENKRLEGMIKAP